MKRKHPSLNIFFTCVYYRTTARIEYGVLNKINRDIGTANDLEDSSYLVISSFNIRNNEKALYIRNNNPIISINTIIGR